jgi:hypothetical protein
MDYSDSRPRPWSPRCRFVTEEMLNDSRTERRRKGRELSGVRSAGGTPSGCPIYWDVSLQQRETGAVGTHRVQTVGMGFVAWDDERELGTIGRPVQSGAEPETGATSRTHPHRWVRSVRVDDCDVELPSPIAIPRVRIEVGDPRSVGRPRRRPWAGSARSAFDDPRKIRAVAGHGVQRPRRCQTPGPTTVKASCSPSGDHEGLETSPRANDRTGVSRPPSRKRPRAPCRAPGRISSPVGDQATAHECRSLPQGTSWRVSCVSTTSTKTPPGAAYTSEEPSGDQLMSIASGIGSVERPVVGSISF